MGRVFLSGGKVDAKKPLTGILASTLSVGSSVYLNENGSPVEYLVVNQGIPSNSSLYASSCNGTWLLRKDIWASNTFHSGNNAYYNTIGDNLINGTFLQSFDTNTQNIISTVKIPYWSGKGDVNTSKRLSGESGLSTKIFLLSAVEVGFTSAELNNLPSLGVRLQYFLSGVATDAANLRIAYLDGTAKAWWTRSPNTGSGTYTYTVTSAGKNSQSSNTSSSGVRPALILPFNAEFDKNTMLLKGVY